MAFVVETGAGLADANAFISVATADAYHAARGNHAWAGTVADKEAAIIRATFYLSNAYKWQGVRRRNRSQALAWPRTNVFDDEGNAVPFDEVPDEIRYATAEVALRELLTPGSMTPDYVAAERVKSETFGPVSFEYDMSRADADSIRPVLLAVRDLIGPLLATGGRSSIAGLTVRA